MVDALVHVGDLLAEVVSGLEARVAEGLSGRRGGQFVVPNARVSHGECSFAIAIVDGVHGAVSAGDLGSIESKKSQS